MPTVTQERLAGYVWCEDPLCAGNTQEPADVVRTTTVYTYVDSGGDLPGPEKSSESYALTNERGERVVSPCPGCGKARAAAAQKRPAYPTSQWAQDGLLKLIRDGMVKPLGEAAKQRDDELDELRAQIAEMRGLLEAKRGPGRPRKSPGSFDDGDA